MLLLLNVNWWSLIYYEVLCVSLFVLLIVMLEIFLFFVLLFFFCVVLLFICVVLFFFCVVWGLVLVDVVFVFEFFGVNRCCKLSFDLLNRFDIWMLLKVILVMLICCFNVFMFILCMVNVGMVMIFCEFLVVFVVVGEVLVLNIRLLIVNLLCFRINWKVVFCLKILVCKFKLILLFIKFVFIKFFESD